MYKLGEKGKATTTESNFISKLLLKDKRAGSAQQFNFNFNFLPPPATMHSVEHLHGLLRIHVHRGVNLARRDVMSSDPYIIFRMGKQKLKTRVVKKNVNPEWNEDLTLSIEDTSLPVKLFVYDRDIFSLDDKMGDAEFQIEAFVEALRMKLNGLPSGTIITRVQPSRDNCLAGESCIVWTEGKVVQNLVLRLRNVESGEVELQLQWIDIPGSKGL